MDAIILAAGYGKRMGHLTKDKPKPLLCVDGKALIDHHLLNLSNSGINNVFINTHYLGDLIETHCKDGSDYNLSITYSKEKEILDTGGAILNILDKLSDIFIVISSDIYTKYRYKNLLNISPQYGHVLLVKNPEYHPNGDFSLERKNQISVREKNSYTYANIGVFSRKMFENYPVSKIGLGKIIKESIKNNIVTGEVFTDDWYNVGTEDELNKANQCIF